MLNILAIISPLFLAIGVGYWTVRKDLFSRSDIRAMGRFVIQIALPALLFKSLADRSLDEIINLDYLAAYASGSLIVLVLSVAGAHFIMRWSRQTLGMVALGSALSNSGFIGFPLVLQFLGSHAVVALALSMVVENLMVMPIALMLAQPAGSGRGRWRAVLHVFSGLATNPLILAIVAGAACSLLQLHLPVVLTRVIDLFAMSAGAVALFVIGGTLVGLSPAGNLTRITWVSAAKLVIHPLAVAAMLLVFTPADPMLRAAAVVIASVPMLSIFPILGQQYGEEAWCAPALLVCTLAGFVTMSLTLWLVG